ncbi:MAG: hypothetical protein II228_05590 [Alistipes sp.]|nr:hypothetical protein [Alistipes sp.]
MATTVAIRAAVISTTTKARAIGMSVVNTAVAAEAAAVAMARDTNSTPIRVMTTPVPPAMVQVVVSIVMAQANKPSINILSILTSKAVQVLDSLFFIRVIKGC